MCHCNNAFKRRLRVFALRGRCCWILLLKLFGFGEVDKVPEPQPLHGGGLHPAFFDFGKLDIERILARRADEVAASLCRRKKASLDDAQLPSRFEPQVCHERLIVVVQKQVPNRSLARHALSPLLRAGGALQAGIGGHAYAGRRQACDPRSQAGVDNLQIAGLGGRRRAGPCKSRSENRERNAQVPTNHHKNVPHNDQYAVSSSSPDGCASATFSGLTSARPAHSSANETRPVFPRGPSSGVAVRQAPEIQGFEQLWPLEVWLRERRRGVDGLLDYRYSQLTFVFAQLILRGHLREDQLTELSEPKFQQITEIVPDMRRAHGHGFDSSPL